MKLNLAKVSDIKTYTGKQKRAMIRDLWHLLGRCDGATSDDGVGFNRYDAGTARQFADDLDLDRPINWNRLAKMLWKYRETQLGGHDDY